MSLAAEYEIRYRQVLSPLAVFLEEHIRNLMKSEIRIDRIQTRPKSIERFLEKSEKTEGGVQKYTQPLHQIQDQVAARIICFYLCDVERVSTVIERYFRTVEARRVLPEREAEFGYFGKHYVLLVPADVVDPTWDKSFIPEFFELQIKTLFQHAWSEADHDLGYKPGAADLTGDQKRRIAFTAAQAWGADRLFDELFRERTG
jgi:ppGpp synthetase/RelA/SpoT-type nucleotidyltranferase